MQKSYSGSCHCGRVQFEVDADITHLRRCNCTVCTKRGSLNVRVSKQALKLLTPIEYLSVYRWGSETAQDYFCPNCGILPFRIPSTLTAEEIRAGKQPFTGWAINARCLDDLDLDQLPVTDIDGASL